MINWTAKLMVLLSIGFVKCCQEELCASVVSKCILLKSCECDMKEIACRKECISCLGDYHGECCSCVGMCSSDEAEDSLPSNVGELAESVPSLFEALTVDEDPLHRWHTFSFPVFYDVTFSGSQLDDKVKYISDSEEEEKSKIEGGLITQNCTVVFKSQCMSWHKCRVSCQSMGAASYRWFHDGCCECIGENCPNYGINENRCESCPITKITGYEENKLDFGETLDY
nr:PREDICTED: protein twisted gastrulation-like [Bemisia tabaci]XP_018904102.1 PREDICTED: protein twisted gastrulation-like [Bemisia tabaci]